MQNTWPVVALAAIAAVFVGAIVGMRRSGSAVQSRAIVWSLCSLALVAALCCIMAALGILASLTWHFAVLLVIVPTAVYICVVLAASRDSSASSGGGSSRGSATLATPRGRARGTQPLAASPGKYVAEQTAPQAPRIVPIEMNSDQPVGTVRRAWAPPQEAPVRLTPAHDGSRTAAKGEVEASSPCVSGDEPFRREPPEAVYPPPLGEAKRATANEPTVDGAAKVLVEVDAVVEPARESMMPVEQEQEPVVSSEPAFAFASEPASELEPVLSPELKSKPELALQSEPESKLERAPAPARASEPASAAHIFEPSSDDCFQKAVAFKLQGLHGPAARLFAEAALLADGDTARRRARFEELSCYVKADQPEKARPLVEELSRSSVLTKMERIKLEAAGRLL